MNLDYVDFAKRCYNQEIYDRALQAIKDFSLSSFVMCGYGYSSVHIYGYVYDKYFERVYCDLFLANNTIASLHCECPLQSEDFICSHVMALYAFTYLFINSYYSKFKNMQYGNLKFLAKPDEKKYVLLGSWHDETTIRISDLHFEILDKFKNELEQHFANTDNKSKLDSSWSLQQYLTGKQQITYNQETYVEDGSVQLIPSISFPKAQLDSAKFYLSLYIKATKKYKIKNIYNFIDAVNSNKFYEFGKFLSFTLSKSMFDESSVKLFDLIQSINTYDYPNIEFSSNLNKTRIYCPCSLLPDILENYVGAEFKIDKTNYQIVEENPRDEIFIKKYCNDLILIYAPVYYELFCGPNAWILKDDVIYKCSNEFSNNVIPIMRALSCLKCPVKDMYSAQSVNHLSQNSLMAFCADILPVISKYFTIVNTEVDFENYIPEQPSFKFYFSYGRDGNIVCKAVVYYGENEQFIFSDSQDYRNQRAEKPVIDVLLKYMEKITRKGYLQVISDDHAYLLLKEGFDELRRFGEVYIDKKLNNFRIAPSPSTYIGVSLGENLINLSVSVDKFESKELQKIMNAYSQKKQYYKLKNGSFINLEDSSLSSLSELNDTLGVDCTNLENVEVSMFRANTINQVLTKNHSNVDFERSSGFKQLVRSINDFKDSDYKLPDSVNATLRNYQKEGFRWLCTLSTCGLDGILADDMGLGKTLQVISALEYFQKSALIVCPATLIYNWEAEYKKFAPNTKIVLIKGTQIARKELLDTKAKIFVTSYDLLKRDILLYKDKKFDFCVADEAQYIRNPKTKASKAIKQIQASTRFALTGTPIENKLSDLWSIFDFVMPGYLFSYAKFKHDFEEPIVAGSKDKTEQLRVMTSNFILRRKKSDVLKELPEKIEDVYVVEMGSQQQKLYDAYQQELKNFVLSESDEGFLKKKMQIFTRLTRLRQICCAPELFLEDYDGGSVKIDTCMDIVCNLANEGHSTLVFSQFTSMLDILCEAAKKANLKYLYLSGKNSKEQRRDMVSEFQSGKYDVFFISLKAGGTGLNLTQADRVIHFDPWWNFAAEQQASDRTHRIGQKNSVYVTKLVAKNTIEEKIVDLQQKKRKLSDSVISGDATASSKFNKEEILELLDS